MNRVIPPDDSPDVTSSEWIEERDDAIIGTVFRWSMGIVGVAAALVAASIWWLLPAKPTSTTPTTKLSNVKVRELPPLQVPEARFRDITSESGLDFTHENGAFGEKLLPETMGGGGGFWDYDNDGDQDLLLINSTRWAEDPRGHSDATLQLYQNNGQGHFTNVTRGSGFDVVMYGMGVAFGDYDRDGLVDAYVSAVGPNRLFRNLGDGKFADVTEAAGVGGDANQWSSSCGWFDFDRDGDLDLFVCNYVRWTPEFDRSQNFQLTGGGRAYGRPQAFEGSFPYLFRNDGDGRFSDVSSTSGVQIRSPETKVPTGKSLGVTFADLDDDGWIDIIVANDTVQNFLLRNRHDGTFEEIGVATGVAYDAAGNARGAMGNDVARFRNSDAIGIAVGNFANEMTALYVSRDKKLQFVDEAIPTGLGPSSRLELTFGLFFFDYDLDGRLDLFAANGHLEHDIHRVQPSQHYEQPAHLFWNCGPRQKTEFIAVPRDRCGDDVYAPQVGRGAAYADIDGDGDLDLLVVNCGQRVRLLANEQQLGHHWLRFKLVGREVNRDAIGSWVEVRHAGGVQWRQVMPTRSYQSQVELPVTFGIGRDTTVQSIRIHWPHGSIQEVTDWKLDQLNEVPEKGVRSL